MAQHKEWHAALWLLGTVRSLAAAVTGLAGTAAVGWSGGGGGPGGTEVEEGGTIG